MSNEYYNASGSPGSGAAGASAPMRGEFSNIAAGFGLLPVLAANAGKVVVINPSSTGMTVTTGALALAGDFATTGAFNTTLTQTATVTLGLPAVNGTLATLAGIETLSNKTLVAPALGTPASGVATNLTGTASGLTAGNVTTNANLTGVITSVGNATSIASQTGTGTKFVVDTSPTLVTPILGVATATTINKVTITQPAAGATLTIPNGITLNAGAGGTLGSNAFTSTAYLPLAGGTVTGGTLFTAGLQVSGGSATAAGQASVLSNANEAIFAGNGAIYDVVLANKNLDTVMSVATGTTVATFISSPVMPTPSTSDNSTKGATTAFAVGYFNARVRTGTVSLTSGVGATITFSPAFTNTCDSIELTPVGSFAQTRAFSYSATDVTVVSDTTTNFTYTAVGH